MDDHEGAEANVRQLIVTFVDDHWERERTAYYLSALGIRIRDTVPESRDILGGGLRDFLRRTKLVQVVQFPGVEAKIGAIPLSADLPDDVRKLFISSKSTKSLHANKIYLKEFWEAFIHPIGGHRRFVVMANSGSIIIDDDLPVDEGYEAYEIREQDLVNSKPGHSVAEKVSSTHLAIEAWLEKHSLDYRAFLLPKAGRKFAKVSNRLDSLVRAFDGLSPEEVGRVHIPLDVLMKLMSSK